MTFHDFGFVFPTCSPHWPRARFLTAPCDFLVATHVPLDALSGVSSPARALFFCFPVSARMAFPLLLGPSFALPPPPFPLWLAPIILHRFTPFPPLSFYLPPPRLLSSRQCVFLPPSSFVFYLACSLWEGLVHSYPIFWRASHALPPPFARRLHPHTSWCLVTILMPLSPLRFFV